MTWSDTVPRVEKTSSEKRVDARIRRRSLASGWSARSIARAANHAAYPSRGIRSIGIGSSIDVPSTASTCGRIRAMRAARASGSNRS